MSPISRGLNGTVDQPLQTASLESALSFRRVMRKNIFARRWCSLLALDYSNYEVIVVNDRSTDRTGQIMDEVAASSQARGLLKVIHISELPAGWLGKTHAMWTASQHASGDWLLFTDADVFFKPDSLRRAVAYAEAERADHVVLFRA